MTVNSFSRVIADTGDSFKSHETGILAEDEHYWYLLGCRIPKDVEITVCSRSGLCYQGVITGITRHRIQIREAVVTSRGVTSSVTETILDQSAIEAIQQHISTLSERPSG